MKFRPLPRIAIAAFFLAVTGVCMADDGQQKPATAASKETPSPATARPQQNGLKNLESDLFKPFKAVSPDSSLDAVLAAPAQPQQHRPQDERRLREKRQREKDWVFMNPEDEKQSQSQSLEEMLHLPTKGKNLRDQRKLSPVEQYYRRALGLDTADRDRDNSLTGKPAKKNGYDTKLPGSLGNSESDEEDETGLALGLRETKRSLKALEDDRLNKKDNSAWNGKGFFTDIFGLGQALPTPAEIESKRIQEERMNDFRKILGVPVVTSPRDSLDPLAGLRPSTPATAPAVTLPSISTEIKALNPNIQLGTIGTLGSGFTAPQNGSSASLFAVPTAPIVDQPRRLMPKASDFSPVQRRF